jgi:hypothetical protein
MKEQRTFSPESKKKSRPKYDFSTIAGIDVDSLELSEDARAMAEAYLEELGKTSTGREEMAELAYGFRRQLQEDLRSVSSNEVGDDLKHTREQLLKQDESHALSLAIYRKLLQAPHVTDVIQEQMDRHQKEKDEINGTYDEFKSIEQELEDERGKLIGILSEMFRGAGKEIKPIHLAKRALFESKVRDLESKLEAVKGKNPDIAALIEYDTVKSYADQLRTTGFIWTKSRQRLLQEVLQGALTSRPVAAIMGETGTGKTALARAASLELASREPERAVGGDQEKFVRLLASPAIEAGKTYYQYGPLLRAMTGKSSSIDDQPSKGGGIFFDDEFNTRPTSVQRQILKFVAEARAGRKVSIPGTPLTVTVEPGFLYLAAGNPPSERYDREETGIETKREFAGNVINVEYLEQTQDNPELYQVMLAALMDQKTGRLTAVTPSEVEPEWIKDAATGEFHLDEDAKNGGYLYRFAQAWGELYKAFSHQETFLHKQHPAEQKAKYHLESFILDAGVVLSWIDQYKASPSDRKEHIGVFFKGRLEKYLAQFPQDEQDLVKTYLEHFNILATELNISEVSKPKLSVLTPKDIGYLNPNVERKPEKGKPPVFEAEDFRDPDTGDILFSYMPRPLKDGWDSGVRLKRKQNAPDTVFESAVFKGFVYDSTSKVVDETKAVVVSKDGIAHLLATDEVDSVYELDVPPPPPAPEAGLERTPFAYDRARAQEYGFSEMNMEKHEMADRIVRDIYNIDSAFVTRHNVGDTDPDDPSKTLTTEKWKVKEDALKTYWDNNCSDLPNVPEKSMWLFHALADRRLSETTDGDDLDFHKIAKAHIPDFGSDTFLLAMDYQEFDYNNAQEKANALTPQTKKILKTLFDTEDPTSITRDEVNAALWSDHERRIHTPKARQVIQELLGSTGNLDDYELRLMRYDEYARGAKDSGWGQKNLWTHMDGYYASADGRRNGLRGGLRRYGGGACVGGNWRCNRADFVGVRVVLSRRNPLSAISW